MIGTEQQQDADHETEVTDAIGQEGAVMAILFWVVGVIYMLIYAKKKF